MSAEPQNKPQKLQGTGLLMTALILGVFMPGMNSTIVSIGLNNMIGQFHTTMAMVQWVSTAYLLAQAVATPIVGWAQARFGNKTSWIAGLVIFLIGSIGAGFAWNIGSLIFFRFVQGFSAGISMPLMQTLLVQEAKSQGIESFGTLMSTISLPLSVAPILGPVLGGLILNWMSWKWLFWINVPFTVVAIILAFPAFHDSGERKASKRSLDIVGLVSSAVGLAGLLLGLTDVSQEASFNRKDVIVPLVVGVLLLVFFVLWPRTRDSERTLIDIKLLRHRSVWSSSVASIAMGMTIYSAQFLLPIYWQVLRHESVLNAALLLVPQGVGSLISRVIAGNLSDKYGNRPVAVAGFLLSALTTVPFCFAGLNTNLVLLSVLLLIRGIAVGIVGIPVGSAGYIGISSKDTPNVSIITKVFQQVGMCVGTAVVAVLLQAIATMPGQTPLSAFRWAFAGIVIMTLVGTVSSIWLPSAPKAEDRMEVVDVEPEE